MSPFSTLILRDLAFTALIFFFGIVELNEICKRTMGIKYTRLDRELKSSKVIQNTCIKAWAKIHATCYKKSQLYFFFFFCMGI